MFFCLYLRSLLILKDSWTTNLNVLIKGATVIEGSTANVDTFFAKAAGELVTAVRKPRR